MRTLALIACTLVAAALLASAAGAAEPNAGTLSVERGRGSVVVELKGSALGRLTNGTLRVTDQTPNDRYAPLVVGKKVTQERARPAHRHVPRRRPEVPDARRRLPDGDARLRESRSRSWAAAS